MWNMCVPGFATFKPKFKCDRAKPLSRMAYRYDRLGEKGKGGHKDCNALGRSSRFLWNIAKNHPLSVEAKMSILKECIKCLFLSIYISGSAL